MGMSFRGADNPRQHTTTTGHRRQNDVHAVGRGEYIGGFSRRTSRILYNSCTNYMHVPAAYSNVAHLHATHCDMIKGRQWVGVWDTQDICQRANTIMVPSQNKWTEGSTYIPIKREKLCLTAMAESVALWLFHFGVGCAPHAPPLPTKHSLSVDAKLSGRDTCRAK